ncbi:Synaptic vesicle 2-related protein [Geodia barretti]|nr:Synaptic vesicle 2-related protein [Geodia barretti]
MELMILSVLAPAVQCQWGLSHAEAATITSVVFVGFLLGGLIWGVISDIIGRKSVSIFFTV